MYDPSVPVQYSRVQFDFELTDVNIVVFQVLDRDTVDTTEPVLTPLSNVNIYPTTYHGYPHSFYSPSKDTVDTTEPVLKY